MLLEGRCISITFGIECKTKDISVERFIFKKEIYKELIRSEISRKAGTANAAIHMHSGFPFGSQRKTWRCVVFDMMH